MAGIEGEGAERGGVERRGGEESLKTRRRRRRRVGESDDGSGRSRWREEGIKPGGGTSWAGPARSCDFSCDFQAKSCDLLT